MKKKQFDFLKKIRPDPIQQADSVNEIRKFMLFGRLIYTYSPVFSITTALPEAVTRITEPA